MEFRAHHFNFQFNLLLNSEKTIAVTEVSCHKINDAVKIAYMQSNKTKLANLSTMQTCHFQIRVFTAKFRFFYLFILIS